MTACTPNIGTRGRRRRLRGGVLAFVAAAILGAALTDAPPYVRALVFLPLLGAGYGFFQYREKT